MGGESSAIILCRPCSVSTSKLQVHTHHYHQLDRPALQPTTLPEQAHLISVVWAADVVKQLGHQVPSGEGDLPLFGT